MISISPCHPNAVLAHLTQEALSRRAAPQPSRLGPVIDLGPCMFELPSGQIQMVDLPGRAINPYLAIVESCWILGGRNDLAPLSDVVKNMSAFSDDGITLAGAYGYRLRHMFEFDQIEAAINCLQNDKYSRRVVLNLFSPKDLIRESRDIPCNTQLMFYVRGDKIDMTVINRSNDILYGLPYNIFSFSLIHYYISFKTHFDIGWQRHFSNSVHLYVRNLDLAERVANGSSNILFDRPQPHPFMAVLIQNADAIVEARWGEISDPRLRNFFSGLADLRTLRELRMGEQPTDWLSELAFNWSSQGASQGIARLPT